ncbi:DUF2934 domain-containing protein [Mesorhizobium sp. C280B]|uniref:DUF2934 domain-containing protein n=1 Tax=unclassified Mesorhizobium TaxID=325217 RepID=UPI0003CF4A14|nr:DUF2934 domain-containing protein [Mesorhizobium sp. LSJC280B00]ESW88789.1 hypothetical protein X772_09345 [Mesorhizobium sp. LSJC280B00]
MTDRQERIRQRAHAIWEQAGRPDGAHQQHWDQATAEIDAETAAPETASRPKPKARQPKPAPVTKDGSKPKAPRKA